MTEPLSEQAHQLHRALTHLVQHYQFRDRNDMCCYGISVTQCYTLQALADHGALSMQALARHLHLAVSTVTRVVDSLVQKQLVARRSDPRDRRVCRVALTPDGTEFLRRIQHELIAREQAILQRIPAASRQHVITALEELARAVDDWRHTVPQQDTDERESA